MCPCGRYSDLLAAAGNDSWHAASRAFRTRHVIREATRSALTAALRRDVGIVLAGKAARCAVSAQAVKRTRKLGRCAHDASVNAARLHAGSPAEPIRKVTHTRQCGI